MKTLKKLPETKLRKEVQSRRDALAAKVYELRMSRDLSQDELAKMCGLDRKTINRIENNHFSPNVDSVIRITMVLGVKVSDLL
jgi:putative transcriptional regulator